MTSNLVTTSKFLSLVLRHKPQEIGLHLDQNGWADIDELIFLVNKNGAHINRALLEEVVASSDKKRFAISTDGKKIRANQGHSVAIELNLIPHQPPSTLFHGTATRFIDAIRQEGLIAGSRQHVHLSLNETVAKTVGKRHGKPYILKVQAQTMHAQGYEFYLSENGVWLTVHVPVQFIEFSYDTPA